MTLYTFDKDSEAPGKSVCNAGCIEAWPALAAAEGSKSVGDFSVITRDDGTKQWAHKGKPVYLWVQDKKPGDKTGDNFKDMWRIVKQK
jgi:predicted lipoprotein with Yx(FWY)xxD motif